MRKILAGASTILLTATLVVASGDVWKSKPYQQWDEKDVVAVLQTSPWAKVNVTTSGAWRPSDTTPITGGSVGYGGSANDTSHTNGAMANQAGGTEKEASAGPSVYNIYWWSSRTIREATLRRQVLKGSTTQDAADNAMKAVPDSYQILVAGQNMAIFQQRGEDAFKNTAFIQLKNSKKRLAPSKVEFQKTADGKVIDAIFSFAKKDASGEPTIDPGEKEIDFNLQVADSWVRVNFTPKQMADSQGEDL
jgi:hypothetical protein